MKLNLSFFINENEGYFTEVEINPLFIMTLLMKKVVLNEEKQNKK